MASEEQGEWKLLKIWECKGCKLLLRGERIFDHSCTTDGKDDPILRLRNTIDNQLHTIDGLNTTIESRESTINNQNKKIDGLENFIKELNDILEVRYIDIEKKDKVLEDHTKVIEDQKIVIDNQTKVIEDQKKTIENDKKTITDREIFIEKQNKNQNKVVEKVVYIEKNMSTIEGNGDGDNFETSVENINVDIWNRDDRIKDSKDEGYREEIEFEMFERGKGREKVIIKSGKVVKKPNDIIVIGKKSPEGFIVKGIYRN